MQGPAGDIEPRDRHVLAVEPSAAMRARRSAAGVVPAINGAAEALPFDDDSIDAAMAIFTVHQWADPNRRLAEVRRVTRGPMVIMTLDVDALDSFWLGDYLPERLAAERSRFPTLAELRAAVGGNSVGTAQSRRCRYRATAPTDSSRPTTRDPKRYSIRTSEQPSPGGSSWLRTSLRQGWVDSLTTSETAAGTPGTASYAANRATPDRSFSSPPSAEYRAKAPSRALVRRHRAPPALGIPGTRHTWH